MKISYLLSIAGSTLLLVACTPTSTMPPSAIQAPTITPTNTQPTATPTTEPLPKSAAESSPTPTGPKEGDTKVENGYTYTYTVIKTAEGKEAYQGWFRSMTPTAIPMYDWGQGYIPDGNGGWIQAKNVSPITILVEENVSGAATIQSFTHKDLVSLSKDQQSHELYIGYMMTFFGTTDEALAQSAREQQSGTLKYPVQFGDTTFDWYPSPDHGAKVYILNYNNPTISKDSGAVEWKDAPYDNSFRTTFWGLDAQGNAIGAIASKQPLDQLNQTGMFNELLIFPYYHVASMLGGTGGDLKQYSGGFSILLQKLMQYSERSDPPYVEITEQTP